MLVILDTLRIFYIGIRYVYDTVRLHTGTADGGTVVKVLCYKSEGRFQMVSLEFFIDIILPITLWPWGRLNL
jgi:hypothetical protein